MTTQNIKESAGRFDFVGKAGLFAIISLVLTVIALAYLGVKGLNYGIDFKGGTEFQVKFDKGVGIDQLRKSVEDLKLGEVGVQSFGEESEFIIRFQGREGKSDKETNEILNEDIAKIRTEINTKFAEFHPDIRRIDTVGPQVGAELKRNGFLAIFYSLLVILIYIAIRFDYKYAPGAVFCLAHDAILTLTVYTLLDKEINIAIIAAVLTLISYSLNDTIVVFDRIRETEKMSFEKGYNFIVNRAINDTLKRTLITSITTCVSALCLFLLAGGVVADISLVVFIGVVYGTYSSIYVAAPTLMMMERLMEKKKV
ncbi:MAG: protein translocase subunit SecF [Bdellovibrio sp.]